MSTTNERLGQQAMEVTKDLQEMGGIVRDAAQEKLGQLRTNVSEQYEQGRDKVYSVERTCRAIPAPAALPVRIDRGRRRFVRGSLLHASLNRGSD